MIMHLLSFGLKGGPADRADRLYATPPSESDVFKAMEQQSWRMQLPSEMLSHEGRDALVSELAPLAAGSRDKLLALVAEKYQDITGDAMRQLRSLFLLAYAKHFEKTPDSELAITSRTAAEALRRGGGTRRKRRSKSEPPPQKQELLKTLEQEHNEQHQMPEQHTEQQKPEQKHEEHQTLMRTSHADCDNLMLEPLALLRNGDELVLAVKYGPAPKLTQMEPMRVISEM